MVRQLWFFALPKPVTPALVFCRPGTGAENHHKHEPTAPVGVSTHSVNESSLSVLAGLAVRCCHLQAVCSMATVGTREPPSGYAGLQTFPRVGGGSVLFWETGPATTHPPSTTFGGRRQQAHGHHPPTQALNQPMRFHFLPCTHCGFPPQLRDPYSLRPNLGCDARRCVCLYSSSTTFSPTLLSLYVQWTEMKILQWKMKISLVNLMILLRPGVSMFSQHHVDQLDLARTPIEEMQVQDRISTAQSMLIWLLMYMCVSTASAWAWRRA